MAWNLDTMQDTIEIALTGILDGHAVTDCPSDFAELINLWLVVYDKKRRG